MVSCFSRHFSQGFIPYATNEVEYGRLVEEEEVEEEGGVNQGAASDIWRLERYDEEFYIAYVHDEGDEEGEEEDTHPSAPISPSGPSRSPSPPASTPSASLHCKDVIQNRVFTRAFAGDFFRDVFAKDSTWKAMKPRQVRSPMNPNPLH